MIHVWVRIREWLLLVVLIVSSIVVMLGHNQPMVKALKRVSLQLTASVESRFAWTGKYLRALDENENLRKDNIKLSSQLALLREASVQNEELHELLGTRASTDYKLQSARIVTRDITRQKNHFTIDKGLIHGVEEGMAIINDKGVLGKVILASHSYAVAQSYLNVDFRLPAAIQSSRTFGIVRWEDGSRDRLILDHVSQTEAVEKGELVVTSSSTVFPPGISIGTVDSAQVRPGQNDWLIYLNPSAPIQKADFVFIIMEQLSPELEKLSAEIENN